MKIEIDLDNIEITHIISLFTPKRRSKAKLVESLNGSMSEEDKLDALNTVLSFIADKDIVNKFIEKQFDETNVLRKIDFSINSIKLSK